MSGLVDATPFELRGPATSVARTEDGTTLPFEVCGPVTAPLRILVAHGLGGSNPSAKDHREDATRPVLEPTLAVVGCRAVWYTARGHGSSTGWEQGGIEQFLWPRLAQDMLAVADWLSLDRFIAAGNSMGAASAIFAALQYPGRVSALIIYRPPCIWETRQVSKVLC